MRVVYEVYYFIVLAVCGFTKNKIIIHLLEKYDTIGQYEDEIE